MARLTSDGPALGAFHETYDLWLLPTVAGPPPRIGELALPKLQQLVLPLQIAIAVVTAPGSTALPMTVSFRASLSRVLSHCKAPRIFLLCPAPEAYTRLHGLDACFWRNAAACPSLC